MCETVRVSDGKKLNPELAFSAVIIDGIGTLEIPNPNTNKKITKRVHIFCERLYEEHRGIPGIVFLENNNCTLAVFRKDAIIELQWNNEWKITYLQ